MGGNYVLLENYNLRSTDWPRRMVARIVADLHCFSDQSRSREARHGRGLAANAHCGNLKARPSSDLHRVRRKSSVNGNWGFCSFGGTTIVPAVWPVS